MTQETDKSKDKGLQRTTYKTKFHSLVLRTIVRSPVFIYPHLLPHLPFRTDVRPIKRVFEPTEDL